MASVGKPLDSWQASMVLDTFALRPDGFWSCFEYLGLVPRQNGKGAYTEGVELPGLFLFGDKLIMHSAHLFKTAKQSFQRVVDIIDASDWLTARVKRIYRARGDEEIELTAAAGGGKLMYFSRSGGAGRGFTGDKTVFDECAYLTIEQYQAATPTLATVPNPQIIYTGTPPDEDVGPMPEDAMLPSVRKRGHAGEDRIGISEWSPEPGFDRKNPKVWAACNPSLGIRIQPWFLEQQLRNFTAAGKPAKFDTEHLGVWPPDPEDGWLVVTEDDWTNALDAQSQAGTPLILAVDVTPERSHSAIAVVGPRADGHLHGEVIDHRPGTSWVAARVVQLVERWKPFRVVVDPSGAAGSLIPELQFELVPKHYEELTLMRARDVAHGYGLFHQHVSSDPGAYVVELPKDAPEQVPGRKLKVREVAPFALTAAVKGATTRRIGDGTTWNRKTDAVDISPLVALTNALHGYVARPAPEVIAPPVSAPLPPMAPFFRQGQRLSLRG